MGAVEYVGHPTHEIVKHAEAVHIERLGTISKMDSSNLYKCDLQGK